MSGLPAGAFDRRIAIEQKVETRAAGGFGDPTVVWLLFARPWAQRKILRGGELFRAQQFGAKTEAIFTLRHDVAGLRHDMRIVDENDRVTTVYDITSILSAERQMGGPELHAFEHAD